MGCASNEKEEAEPPEVQLYRMAQDRINAQNYLGALLNLLQELKDFTLLAFMLNKQELI